MNSRLGKLIMSFTLSALSTGLAAGTLALPDLDKAQKLDRSPKPAAEQVKLDTLPAVRRVLCPGCETTEALKEFGKSNVQIGSPVEIYGSNPEQILQIGAMRAPILKKNQSPSTKSHNFVTYYSATVVPCSTCQTSSDFMTVARAYAQNNLIAGPIFVVNLSYTKAKAILVEVEREGETNYFFSYYIVSGTPADVYRYYGGVSKATYRITPEDRMGGSYSQCQSSGACTAMSPHLHNVRADLNFRLNTFITVIWPDGSKVDYYKACRTSNVCWQEVPGTAFDDNGNPINPQTPSSPTDGSNPAGGGGDSGPAGDPTGGGSGTISITASAGRIVVWFCYDDGTCDKSVVYV